MCVEVNRILERCQKEARAVDTESLCIIAGQKVCSWHLQLPMCYGEGGREEGCVPVYLHIGVGDQSCDVMSCDVMCMCMYLGVGGQD